jgi:hypothetical protein
MDAEHEKGQSFLEYVDGLVISQIQGNAECGANGQRAAGKCLCSFAPFALKFFWMNEMGKFLVIAGLAIAAVGALLWSGLGRSWLGRLPGDINYHKGGFSFHFPVVTCLILSVLLTLLLWLFRK